MGTSEGGLVINGVVLDGDDVVLNAGSVAVQARCPSCGTASARVHDCYRRRPRDLPWRGRRVRFVLTVRRFVCADPACPRRTFAEDIDARLPPRARRTSGADALLLVVARAAGAEAGARTATAMGLPVSPDTLLRLERRACTEEAAAPRVLGVDDFALRRGKRYATLLVDLETRRPVDVLRGREAAPLVAWLRAHPGTEIVSRDRAGEYAEAAAQGAPGARQVADRFHLVSNAAEALGDVLRSRDRRAAVQASRIGPGPVAAVPPPPPSAAEQRRATARALRVARWEEIRARRAAGQTISAIARAVGMGRMTVRRWLDQADPPPARGVPPRPPDAAPPALRPYLDYLRGRWAAGCTNVAQLHRELIALGCTAGRTVLTQLVLPWRGPRPPPRARRFKARWLCQRAPDSLGPEERAALDQLLADHPDLAAGHDLVQRFRGLVAARDAAALATWLADARASGLAPFVSLAAGIEADRGAVDAALTTRWSNGPVEGHINRVKALKRRGYGRAKLDLLRARILAA